MKEGTNLPHEYEGERYRHKDRMKGKQESHFTIAPQLRITPAQFRRSCYPCFQFIARVALGRNNALFEVTERSAYTPLAEG